MSQLVDNLIGNALMERYHVDPLPAKHKPVARAMWPSGWAKVIGEPELLPEPTNVSERLYPAADRADAIRRML